MDTLFAVITPLGYSIRTTKTYWQYLINVKHPCMADKQETIKQILEDPDKICRSAIDDTVYLYYRKMERLYCAVAKHNPADKNGFLITAYPADKVKEGEVVWKK